MPRWRWTTRILDGRVRRYAVDLLFIGQSGASHAGPIHPSLPRPRSSNTSIRPTPEATIAPSLFLVPGNELTRRSYPARRLWVTPRFPSNITHLRRLTR